jgi:hypothetical protein
MSIFAGLDGNTTRKTGIEWAGTPEEIGAKLKRNLLYPLLSAYSSYN